MKRYALLLLLVLGLSTSVWGSQIGMGYTYPGAGTAQWLGCNPYPMPHPRPNPHPNPCPTPCPPPNPCPQPSPCPSPCLTSGLAIYGGLEVCVGLKYSAFDYCPSYGYGTPCYPFAPAWP